MSEIIETEAKIKVTDKNFLKGLKFLYMKNVYDVYFDKPDGSFYRDDIVLRVRKNGDKAMITYKGPRDKDTNISSRNEIEEFVGDFETMRNIFLNMGFVERELVEKYRLNYSDPQFPDLKIELDEYPFMGTFVELEGTLPDIGLAMEKYGFSMDDAIPKNAGEIFEDFKKEHGLSVNLTFEDERKKFEEETGISWDEEIILVDEKDEEIGTCKRLKKKKGQMHRISAGIIRNKEEDILLVRRAFFLRNHPGKWGPSVTGTVEVGETYASNIIKETEEELGVRIEGFMKAKKVKGKRNFCQFFFATVDKDIKLKPNQEVSEFIWISEEDLRKEFNEHPEIFSPAIEKYLSSE